MGLLGGLLPPVVATLLADTGQFSLKMDEAAGKMGVVDAAGHAASDKMVRNFALAGAGVLVASLHLSDEFQTQMTRLYTAAGAPKAAVQAATGQVLAMGDAVGFSGVKMAEALYHPVSAGLDLKTSLEAVKQSAIEAQISGAALDDTTYSLSSVMKAFNIDASGAHDTMALLNAIVGQGDMRFQDFNVSVKNWAPTSAQMGISIKSMGAALAYLTDRGNSAEEASTRVTMGLTMMAYPSQKAAKQLEGLGVASADVAASNEYMTSILKKTGITQNQLAEDLKKPNGIYVALTHLKGALEKAGVAGTEADSVMSKVFGGGRSDKAILSLMQNLDGLKTKYDDIGAGVQRFDQSWADTQKTLHFKLEQLKATFENIAITIGNVLLPAVSAVVGWFGQHKVAVEALAIAIGVVLAGAMLRWVQLSTTKVLTTLSDMVSWFGKSAVAARAAAAETEGASVSAGGWAGKLGKSLPVIGLAVVAVGLLSDKLGKMSGVGDHTSTSLNTLTGRIMDVAQGAPGATAQFGQLAQSLMFMSQKANDNRPVQALKDMDAALAQLVQSGHADQAAAGVRQIYTSLGQMGVSVGYIHDQVLPQYNDALSGMANQQREAGGSADAAGAAVAGTVAPLNDATDAAQGLADAVSAADGAWQTLSNHITTSGMLHSFQKDLLSVKDAVQQNGHAFDENSLKGLANMEAFRQAADEIVKYRDQTIKNGQVLPDVANKTATAQITALEKTWTQLGVNKTQVDAYAKQLGLIPADLTTTLTVKQSGLTDLAKQLDALNAKREALGQTIIVGGTKVQAHAAGGYVSGEGGATSDSIPARLSNGEFVMQASAVSRFGIPFMNAVNAGRAPSFAPASGGGSSGGGGSVGPVLVEVYLDGQKTSGLVRKQTLRYDMRNSGNNLALSGGGFK